MSNCTCTKDPQVTCIVHPTENEMPDLAPGKLFKASGATCLCIAELQAENERLRRTIEEYDDMLDTIKGVFE